MSSDFPANGKMILLALSVLFSFLSVSLALPGVEATITAKGLKHIGQDAISVFQSKISSAHIPDASGSEHISVIGTVDWTVSNIKIVALSLPSCEVAGSAGNEVTVALCVPIFYSCTL